MTSRFFIYVLTALIGTTFALPGLADTVYLNNGDRITGTLSMEKPGRLVVSTEYAGDIVLDTAAVAAVESEAPLAVEYGDGEIMEGRFWLDGDAQQFGGERWAASIDLSEVRRLAEDTETLNAIMAEAMKPPKAWSGAVDSGVTFRSGEKDTFDATLDIEFVRERPQNTLTLRLNSAYGESDAQLDTQQLEGSAKWQFYPKKRFYYFGMLGGEHDKLRRLELRTTTGVGVGYDFIKNDTRTLSADAGAEFVHERWENYGIGGYRRAVNNARTDALDELQALANGVADGAFPLSLRALSDGVFLIREIRDPDLPDEIRTEEYVTARLNVKYEQTIFKDSKIEDELVVLPNLDEIGEFRLTNRLAFTTPFSDSLSLRVQLRSEYESEPGSAVEEFDNTLTLGVRWKY